MNVRLLALLGLAAFVGANGADARGADRVSPASLPLPLPGATAVPPDQLRAHNPWNLPRTGTWHFQLTRGQMLGGRYVPASLDAEVFDAQSSEGNHPPQDAFDGKAETRWCAGDETYPQWLAVNLGAVRRVTAMSVVWEQGASRYRCLVKASRDGKRWETLADASAGQGVGDGPLPVKPAEARYLRIVVLGSTGGWASLRECSIRVKQGGQEVTWAPAATTPTRVPAATRDAFAQPGYSDAAWHNLAVPSNWEIEGYSLPTYNSVDKAVGLYRRWVTVPASWAGRHIVWRFDGALVGAEVFVNGRRAGYHESGYTAFDVDLTGLVKPGQRNLFAVRVCKQTPSSDCETGDFQAMGGIYRETSLIAVPTTHVTSLIVRTPLSADYRDATLAATVVVRGKPGETVNLNGRLVGANGAATGVTLQGLGRVGAGGTAAIRMSAPVKAPRLWSAEKPNLYYLLLDLKRAGQTVERVEQRFGFRQVEVKNNVVLWNGWPIKCQGVCRHDYWADRGFALTDTQWKRDIALMKAANINAVRTSHYNHAARFLELCEEKGLYILDEVPYCWIGDSVKDPAFLPYLVLRARDTLGRDINRPCVLAWSIGNENPSGPNSQALMDLARSTDPTRPAFVSCVNPNDIKGQAWEDDHYPSPDGVDYIASHGDRWPANFSEHPHIFYQRETQAYDPGASDLWSETLIKTWEKIWKAPTILGSFIWEWQNQGIADKNPDRTHDFYYGKDHMRQENNKGIVDAFRHPKPEWWIVKMAYSPVVVDNRDLLPSIDGTTTVSLTNHYAFTDLKELTCRWTVLRGASVLRSGTQTIACAPMEGTRGTFPAPDGMTSLRLQFLRPDGTEVVAANLPVRGMTDAAAPKGLPAGSPLAVQETTELLRIANDRQTVIFDRRTGALKTWIAGGRTLLEGATELNLGEAKESTENGYYHADQPPALEDARITVEPYPAEAFHVTVKSVVKSSPGGEVLGNLLCDYEIYRDASIDVGCQFEWTAAGRKLWEFGLKLPLAAGLDRMAWQRDSYFLDYPAGHIGEPSGTCRASDLSFRASKRQLHWMTLNDALGAGLALTTAPQQPVVARAVASPRGGTLFVSSEVAGPVDFSGSWVENHNIAAKPGQPLGFSFMLRGCAR